jgi:hypothetical protein
MNLYVISQTANDDYDTYDSAVVAAESEDEARMIHPNRIIDWDGEPKDFDTWTAAKNVKVELIGQAVTGVEMSIIVASFRAG